MSRNALRALPLLLVSLAACGGGDEDTASVVGNADEASSFFRDEKLYYVRITGWDKGKMTPQSLEDETTIDGATLRIFETSPTSERHCPDGEGKQVYETKLFSLRTSGNFTKGTPKSSYKVKITEDDSKKRFRGMKDLNLKSMWNDVSQMREAIAWDLFGKAGVPAPRHTWAKLCIGDKYFGLYSFVEEVDKAFLKQRFDKDDDGNLYKAYWRTEDIGPADLTWRSKGSDDSGKQYKKAANEARTYEQKTNEDDEAMNGYDDLASFVRVLNGKTLPEGADFSSPEFAEQLDAVLDTEAFLRWASVNMLLGAWDNYWATPANYYLYNQVDDPAAPPRFTFIPWDYDNSLGIDYVGTTWQTTSIVDWAKHTTSESKALPLVQNLLQNDRYLAYYLDFMDCVLDEWFNEKWIKAKIGDEKSKKGIWQVIRRAAYLESDSPTGAAHTGRQFTNDQVYKNGYLHEELETPPKSRSPRSARTAPSRLPPGSVSDSPLGGSLRAVMVARPPRR
jgi:hypothetical protein